MASRRLIEKIKERLDREIGTIYKPHAGKIKFALAFPNTYYIGMSNLGLQIVYRLLNEREDVVCERVFLPDPPDLDELLRTGKPLVTMESQTPVRDFDVLGFSVSYELDYPNVLRILSLSGLKPLSSDRDSADPLIIAGGPTATFNPEVLAPFMDAFTIGDAEETLPELMDVVRGGLTDDRESMLLELANVNGVYVPRFYQPVYNPDGTLSHMHVSPGVPEKVHRRCVPNLDVYPATSVILTPETEFSNMILAEVARGCGRKCRFCAAGYTYLPPRARSAGSVLEGIRAVEEKAERRGVTVPPRVGLLSASVFDHPSSLLICETLAERGRLFSISSTRADTLTQDIVQALHRGGHETLTIAPEAGTERLRCVINKNISDQELLDAARTAWDGGFRRLKLYFMVGLPTETDEDIDGVISLTERIAGMYDWQRISVSVSCFVPKPWTPFQWADMAAEKVLADKLLCIRNGLLGIKHVEVQGESAREAVAQGVLARGDRRLADSLILLSSQNISWKAAFRKGSIDPSFYAQRFRSRDEMLPWDHLDLGVSKDFLWREFERSRIAARTPACMVGTCRLCGVCPG